MKSARRRRSVKLPEMAASVEPRLSENISLFQSLRVLQEGEEDSETASSTGMYYIIFIWHSKQWHSTLYDRQWLLKQILIIKNLSHIKRKTY